MIRQKILVALTLAFIGLSSTQALAQSVSAEDIQIDGDGNIVVGNNIRIGITNQTAKQMVADREDRIKELEDIVSNRRFIVSGRWSNDREQDGFSGWLSVYREVQGSFYFSLRSVFGSHTCDVQGRADFEKANVAQFRGEEECSIRFDIDQSKEVISISKESLICNLCGMQGQFSGQYYRNEDVFSNKVLLPINVLEFMELVGDDYTAFQKRMTRIYSEKIPDLDGFDAIVTAGSAAGFADSPAIIMQRPDGAIWAAYVDWSSHGKGHELKYWSNVAGWDQNLPDTIREWIANDSSIDTEALRYVRPKGTFSRLSPLNSERNLTMRREAAQVWYGAPLEGRPSWCSNAGTVVEIAVCNSPVLSGKDVRLNSRYNYLKKSLTRGEFSQVKDVVQRFVTARDKCGSDVPCIASKYRSVLSYLAGFSA